MRHAVAVACLVAALLRLGAATAQEPDGLSGNYRPVGEEAVSGDGAGGVGLRVVREGNGWRAWFAGQPKRLEVASPDQMAGLFPGVGESRGLRCGWSEEFVLCRVTPGTFFPRQGFRIDSGYFSVIAGAGLYELERVEATPDVRGR
ncbi:hypothetical protein [Luteimonas sp. R10]|uniref:hypothetical protein n=1 Tax=Luteimonas sp. R10 TaxID=3108176 RepID=UPI003088F8C1|nr:hypothetical protein U3649_13740 [Luteimonas sp. R10]